jgi:hypothetical protein
MQLTPHAAETWLAALGELYGDRVEIVNRAVVQLAASADPFPDLGKLLLACEVIRRGKEGNTPQGEIKFNNTTALAEAWGLKI